MSLNFLIERDRHGRVPTRITVYEDPDAANERLHKLEDGRMAELDAGLKAGKPVRMEYVVPGAESLETIAQTHARYFRGECEVPAPTEIRYLTGWRDDLHLIRAKSPAAAAARCA